jgi:hypothetical protein
MTQRGQWSVIASTTSSPIRSSRPTHLLSTGHVVREPRRRHSVVGLVHPWIGIEAVVRHDPVDQVVDDRGDPATIDAHRLHPGVTPGPS